MIIINKSDYPETVYKVLPQDSIILEVERECIKAYCVPDIKKPLSEGGTKGLRELKNDTEIYITKY